MRLVTLNTWKNEGDYARRLELMADGLAALSPDIVCLQEAFAAGSMDTAARLAQATGLALHARPSRVKPRPHGGRFVDSACGLAMLVRHPVAAEDMIALESDPRDGERTAQRMDLAPEGRALRVLNLHLTHLRGPEAEAVRGRQLAQALAWAHEGWDGDLVVAGDLNAALEEEALAPLRGPGPTLDLPTLQAPQGLDGPGGRARTIDHAVLVQARSWRVAGLSVEMTAPDPDGFRPSDHAAVVLDLAPA